MMPCPAGSGGEGRRHAGFPSEETGSGSGSPPHGLLALSLLPPDNDLGPEKGADSHCGLPGLPSESKSEGRPRRVIPKARIAEGGPPGEAGGEPTGLVPQRAGGCPAEGRSSAMGLVRRQDPLGML